MPRSQPARAWFPKKSWIVARRGPRMTVRTDRGEYEVDQVLGADGANSVVRKKLARPFARAQLSVAAGFFVHGATALEHRRQDDVRTAWISVVVSSARSSRGRHLRRGGSSRDVGRPSRAVGGVDRAARPPSEHAAHAVRLAHSEHRLQARREVTSGRRRMDAARRRGRAGRSADARRHLLRAGCRASGRPMRSRRRPAHAPRRGMRTGCSSDIHPELARAARLSRLFFTPAFSSLLVRALDQSEGIRDVFVDLVGGVQPYRGLRRRLLATREWGLAARAIRMLLRPGFTGTMIARRVTPRNVTKELRHGSDWFA